MTLIDLDLSSAGCWPLPCLCLNVVAKIVADSEHKLSALMSHRTSSGVLLDYVDVLMRDAFKDAEEQSASRDAEEFPRPTRVPEGQEGGPCHQAV